MDDDRDTMALLQGGSGLEVSWRTVAQYCDPNFKQADAWISFEGLAQNFIGPR